MCHAPDDRHGWRVRAMIVVLWRAGLRIQEALALAERDLDVRRGSEPGPDLLPAPVIHPDLATPPALAVADQDRSGGDHHGRAHPPGADDVRQRRAAALIDATPDEAGAPPRSRLAYPKQSSAREYATLAWIVQGSHEMRHDVGFRSRW